MVKGTHYCKFTDTTSRVSQVLVLTQFTWRHPQNNLWCALYLLGRQCHCALLSEVDILGDAVFARHPTCMVSVAQSPRVTCVQGVNCETVLTSFESWKSTNNILKNKKVQNFLSAVLHLETPARRPMRQDHLPWGSDLKGESLYFYFPDNSW